jgi:DNA polymerase III epsilon subunit-like protein
MKITLVFDVETTGLLNMKYGVLPKLDDCPYVVQCSYILYDIETHEIIKTMNSYVKIPENIPIPAESTAIHGITREMCDSGRLMADILMEFYEDYYTASVLVAHNFKFDTKLLNIEFQRNWPHLQDNYPCALKLFLPVYMEEIKKDHICTMESSTELCKIGFPSGREDRYKWPTLLELYRHLFLKTPENLHDSMMDCLVCLRCFLKISCTHDLEDDVFDAMVRSFIP